LLFLGIPDFKLEKHVVHRRIKQMEAEGITFRPSTWVGRDYPTEQLKREFDAICLTGGATVPRDLPVPGRELKGVHFAMEYLTQQNRRLQGKPFSDDETITAKDKVVVILGGGDTGADCLGTAHRQGAKHVYQFELLPQPPADRPDGNPWPQWPTIFRTSAAHEEGGEQDYNISTKAFSGENGKVTALHGVRLAWTTPDGGGRPQMQEIAGSEFTVDCDLVLLAMGFLHGDPKGLLEELGVRRDERGNVVTDDRMMTSVPGVFAGGDMQRGQSLVVHAIAGGRMTARGCDEWLMGQTQLPRVRGYARSQS
jgi:glutamate synthase (NADPH/NADH) small chain